ncbi:SUN domain-containing protein 1 isoform X2 [Perca flavescens]|uniref:SUN domain-containing protein 1 isoform X2 n=1 Tax=Perca flavescens TaxID=8167 RepID=UPI00106E97E2|nr:SUN domain-containing protein 1-like isoform X2 [Perca flavescens]
MSRRSLRLDDGVLDRSLPLGSASFSAGGVGWRSTRSLKSRGGSHHAPSSRSLLLPPSCVLNTSVMSDASLLSSLLDESSVRESTLVDTFWGLDQDIDPKESTMVADQSTVLADCTLIGSDGRCPKHVAQTISRVYCKDCELSDRKHVSSSKYSEPETPTVYCRERKSKSKTARSGLCGVMNVREALAGQKELHPNGSLCDDCREKRSSEPDTVSSSSSASLPSSGTSCLLWLMWSAAVFTGKKAGDVFRRLNRRWHHMTTGLTRFPLRLLLVLLPLLLLFSVCLFGPASLQSLLPAVNLTEWRTVVSDVSGPSSVYSSVSSQSHAAPGATEESGEVEQLYSPPPAAAEEETSEAVADESARLGRLERSLRALWERVEAGGQRAEQRHAELLHLYTDLLLQQQLVSDQSHGDTVQPWLNGLLQQQLEQQLEHLQRRLDEERRQTEQSRQQDVLQQQSQTARLDQLELQLQKLAARTEDMQQRREAATTVSPLPTTLPAAIRGGVERQSHDALLAEVARLKAALERVRRNVGGLSGCRDGCRGLDTIHQTISEQVSARVREEVRVLVYGNQLSPAGGTSRDDGGLQESLLQWLSRRYVSEADLQVALSSLERSVLQNISLQLEELKKHRGEGTGGQPVQHAAAGDAVTREEVQVMVKNALRLFSQDRTGMADYALESGGGSVLSTRCSETFETKAALLSLFGLPLWYFSQSPRAVIQPDVHPGNCWAFRGSTGFLVIRLSMKILPTAFSLEHIPKILAPSGALHSAPRDFNVYGLDDESQEKGKLLGSFTYEEDGEALQTYAVTEENDRAFQIIEVQVLSNWGHQEYTCMYRFRVHGTPRDT